jgi:hypothetical protein
LRSFGGECGAENNTTQLVNFSTDNRQKITQAASEIRAGSKATLLRGITQAVEDFSQPLAQRAKQVNRIIVVTRHGTDACDEDTAFVEKEIRDRITAAGVTIAFRLIGYQVPDNQRDHLTQIATGAGHLTPCSSTPLRTWTSPWTGSPTSSRSCGTPRRLSTSSTPPWIRSTSR